MASPSVSCRRHLRRPVPAWKSATLPSTPSHRPSRHCPACVHPTHFIQVPYRLTAGFPATGDLGIKWSTELRFESPTCGLNRGDTESLQVESGGIDGSGKNVKGRQAAVLISRRRIADGGLFCGPGTPLSVGVGAYEAAPTVAKESRPRAYERMFCAAFRLMNSRPHMGWRMLRTSCSMVNRTLPVSGCTMS